MVTIGFFVCNGNCITNTKILVTLTILFCCNFVELLSEEISTT